MPYLKLTLFCLCLMMMLALGFSDQTCDSIYYYRNKKIAYKDLFIAVYNTYWQNCIRQCAIRENFCKSLSFNRETKRCDLGLTQKFEDTADSSYRTTTVEFFNVTAYAGNCSGNTCSMYKTCEYFESYKQYVCIDSACVPKPEIPHSTHTGGGREVGSRIDYTCHEGYHAVGIRKYKICKPNYKWSDESLACASDICRTDLDFTIENGICYQILTTLDSQYSLSTCGDFGAVYAQVYTPETISFYALKIFDFKDKVSCFQVDGYGFYGSIDYPANFYLLYDGTKVEWTVPTVVPHCMYLNATTGKIFADACDKICGSICEIPMGNKI